MLDQIRRNDLTRLRGQTYLDYTGASIYRDSQLEKSMNQLKNTLYGNNHGQSPCAKTTDDTILVYNSYFIEI